MVGLAPMYFSKKGDQNYIIQFDIRALARTAIIQTERKQEKRKKKNKQNY